MTTSNYISVAGVIANLLVVLAAILVPMWQRKAMLDDVKQSERKAWERFIEAFRAFAAAFDRLIEADKMDRPAKAYEAVEPHLRGASEALAEASAPTLPIKAVINSTMAQEKAAAIFAHLPDLKLYGSNLLTNEHLKAEMTDAHRQIRQLLDQTAALLPRQTL